jgi:hypothetical protein
MHHKHLKHWTFVAAALAGAASMAWATAASAAYVYAPGGNAAPPEQPGNAIMFNRNADQHIEWVYDKALFGDAPVLINGFSWRHDSIVSNQFFDSGVFALDADFFIKVGVLMGDLTSDQNANLGAHAVTAMSGATDLAWSVDAPEGQTKGFGVHFVFDAPFRYDPRLGDLVIDTFIPSQVFFGTMDYARTTTSIRWAGLGLTGTGGPVTRFDVAGVPEPGAWALMLLGFGGMGGLIRRRRAFA